MLSYKAKTNSIAMRIGYHILLWCLITYIYFLTFNRIDPHLTWVFVLKELFTIITVFYSFSYYVLPQWILMRKVPIGFSALILPVAYLWWGINTYFTCYYIFHYQMPNERLENYVEYVLEVGIWAMLHPTIWPVFVLDFIYATAFPLTIKFVQTILKENDRRLKSEREKAILELSFLRSQLNPHFLFNALNSLHRMVTSGNAQSGDTILSISSLLHYTLYECDEPYVLLSQELDFIKNYLHLQQLRFGDKLEIAMECNLRGEDPWISPLLFFVFIENAFKHGPEKSSGKSWVKIKIDYVEVHGLAITIGNTIPPEEARNENRFKGRGIGMDNATKRLKLHYPQRHKLRIEKTKTTYMVHLYVKLR